MITIGFDPSSGGDMFEDCQSFEEAQKLADEDGDNYWMTATFETQAEVDAYIMGVTDGQGFDGEGFEVFYKND